MAGLGLGFADGVEADGAGLGGGGDFVGEALGDGEEEGRAHEDVFAVRARVGGAVADGGEAVGRGGVEEDGDGGDAGAGLPCFGAGPRANNFGDEFVAHDDAGGCDRFVPLGGAASAGGGDHVVKVFCGVEVGAADAAGEDAGEDLAGAWLGCGEGFDGEGLAAEDHGAHEWFASCEGSCAGMYHRGRWDCGAVGTCRRLFGMAEERGRRRIVLATNNPGKVRELRRLIEPAGYEVTTPGALGVAFEVGEDGGSYAENAVKKARACAEATGMLALADDSGVEVDALGGGPGMYSARFGGPGLDDEGRTRRLLEELAGVPEGQRTARYRAVVALAWPEREGRAPVTFEGVEEGRVGLAPRGSGGFGYDPVFVLGDGRTQAELSDEEKDAVSHRGKAVRAALAWLAGEVR